MPLFDELLVFHDAQTSPAATNMAIDEALLECSRLPAIRFYRWQRPSLSFGYFGRFAEVAAFAEERELVRRWTGGGIVLHGQDLTYSVIIPVRRRADLPDSRTIYRAVHRAISDAFAMVSVSAELTESPGRANSNSCFASPVVADVMFDGRKIAGAAHRRSKLGLLHQGSIQGVPIDPGFDARLAALLSDAAISEAIPPAAYRRAEELTRTKYGSREWLERC